LAVVLNLDAFRLGKALLQGDHEALGTLIGATRRKQFNKSTREDSPASNDQSGVKLSSNPHPPVSELLAASNGQNTGISELEAALQRRYQIFHGLVRLSRDYISY
jgi:hypothetical protein